MSQAKSGDTVKVHYTGTLNDGTKFDSSSGAEPLEFTLGGGNIIPGFETAVLGMSKGESKKITIPSHEAYGPRNENLTQEVPRSAMPDDVELTPGIVLHAQGPDGQTVSFTVMSFDDANVRIDGNHPLAGQDLTFALELLEIS